MRWEKSVPSNLFPKAGIPVTPSSDKRGLTVCGIDNWYWSHCQNTSEKISKLSLLFGHSEFIMSQSLFVSSNMVLKTYWACQTFSKCQSYSNESCLSKCTYTYKIDAVNQLHNCVCGACCLWRWWCCKYT